MADTKQRDEKIAKKLEELKATIARAHDQILDIELLVSSSNPIGEFMGTWERLWKAQHKADYAWNRTVDPANIKRLIKKLGLTELTSRARAYISSREPFYQRQQHPFNLFVAQVNTFAGRGTETEAPRPADCRHEPPCRSDQEHTDRKLEDMRKL